MRKEFCIEQAEKFLRETFDKSEFLNQYPEQRVYRLAHSIRVANIGREIAAQEGLDIEMTTIACLLHDISYCMVFKDRADIRNHGRYAAEIARPFIESLGFSKEETNEMCYGIAIHVDDKADFEGVRTCLAVTVGDADNIDRLDAFRIHETLEDAGYTKLSDEERLKHIEKILGMVNWYREHLDEMGTATARKMFEERLDFYGKFYLKLKKQVENSTL